MLFYVTIMLFGEISVEYKSVDFFSPLESYLKSLLKLMKTYSCFTSSPLVLFTDSL